LRAYNTVLKNSRLKIVLNLNKYHFEDRVELKNSRFLTWYGDAGQRTGARVQVVEQDPERVRVELDDVELRLGQLGAIDLLGVGADGEAWHGQLVVARLVLVLVLAVPVCRRQWEVLSSGRGHWSIGHRLSIVGWSVIVDRLSSKLTK